jgi:hypothetical protein
MAVNSRWRDYGVGCGNGEGVIYSRRLCSQSKVVILQVVIHVFFVDSKVPSCLSV